MAPILDSARADTAQHAEHTHPATPPEPVQPARTLAEAGDLLRALAAPIRIAIVLQLRASERCVHELVNALGVAQPLISQHLRVLKAARVVAGERRGREVVYRLLDDHLAHIVVDAVEHVRETEGGRASQRASASEERSAAGSRADGAEGEGEGRR